MGIVLLRVNLLPFDMLSRGRRPPDPARTEELALRMRAREWEALEAMRRFDSRLHRRAVSLPEAALTAVDHCGPWIDGLREDRAFARRELGRFYDPRRAAGGDPSHGESTSSVHLILRITPTEIATFERWASAVHMPVADLFRAAILWSVEVLAHTDGMPPTIMPIWMREEVDASARESG